jgi:dihydroxyacetone kinase
MPPQERLRGEGVDCRTVLVIDDIASAPVGGERKRRGIAGNFCVFKVAAAAADSGVQERVEASPESERAAGTVRAALAEMLKVVSDNEAELGRLDSVAGDSDHGVGMVGGLRAANAAAESVTGGVGSVLRSAGAAFADRPAGPAACCGARSSRRSGTRSATSDPRPPSAWPRVFGGAVRWCTASVGDKTFLDALIPFAEDLHTEVAAGHSLTKAWSTAAAIAKESAERTADLLLKMGWARPLGERSLGTPDPGAISMAFCLEAATRVVAHDC